MPHAETVSHHETGQLGPVDQPDGRSARTRGGAPSAFSEASRGDEHSLGRAEAVNGGEEAIHFVAGYRSVSVIALGLNADLVQAELIERDDAIDALIAWPSSVFNRSGVDPVPDRPEQTEHKLLEELGISVRDQIKQIPPKTLLYVLQAGAYVVIG